ncbi:MAG: hypothetical protein NC218_09215 [Acetobacter sp.]|nr:hypothetical protein [Acetobacter sp.]
MLNAKGERELAYVVKIDGISPIAGADRVELAHIGGWRIMVKKGQFQVGDYAIYFEIDSKVPEKEPFMFLEPKHFKVKTQKYFKGTVISQGLLMALDDFILNSEVPSWVQSLKFQISRGADIEHEGLTEVLGVTYAVEEDNKRKAASVDKYKKMAQRRPNIFKQPWAKWMMRREWGRKVMFALFGKKKDKKNGWPTWVSKTDEERVQNMTWILEDKSEWIATEKIDGTSTTATYRRTGRKKHEFYICSRNVVFDKPDKGCYYDTNVYTEMAEKYHFEDVLAAIVEKYNLEWATLQGETYGAGIQKREYGLKGHDFVGFNLIFSDRGRLNSVEAKAILAEYSIPWVPIVDEHFVLPDTVEELLAIATDKSVIDGGMREGLVFRSQDGARSFKAVSNEFLLKYHNG